MNCNDVIKLLRTRKYYTQEYVANYLCICQKAYSNYELGYNKISLELLIKLAQLYDVDMNYISGISSVANTYPRE